MSNPVASNILKQEIFLDDTYLQNLLVPNSRDYRAYHTIVAGNDVYPLSFDFRPARPATGNVTLEDGAHVEMIAGSSIAFEPGVDIDPGAEVYAHIEAPQTCSQPLPKLPAPAEFSSRPEPALAYSAAGSMKVFPNPFSATTTIDYTVDLPAPVSLIVSDPLGRTIRVLVDVEIARPGNYRISFDAGDLPSGWYSCILRVGNRVELRKIVLEK